MKPEEQVRFTPEQDIITEVITLQEAADLLGISDSYLRKKVLAGEFKDWQYRKTRRVILFNLKVIMDMVSRR